MRQRVLAAMLTIAMLCSVVDMPVSALELQWNATESSIEERTENVTESSTGERTENVTESSIEERTENVTESSTEERTENATESSIEESTENAIESSIEESTEVGESQGTDIGIEERNQGEGDREENQIEDNATGDNALESKQEETELDADRVLIVEGNNSIDVHFEVIGSHIKVQGISEYGTEQIGRKISEYAWKITTYEKDFRFMIDVDSDASEGYGYYVSTTRDESGKLGYYYGNEGTGETEGNVDEGNTEPLAYECPFSQEVCTNGIMTLYLIEVEPIVLHFEMIGACQVGELKDQISGVDAIWNEGWELLVQGSKVWIDLDVTYDDTIYSEVYLSTTADETGRLSYTFDQESWLSGYQYELPEEVISNKEGTLYIVAKKKKEVHFHGDAKDLSVYIFDAKENCYDEKASTFYTDEDTVSCYFTYDYEEVQLTGISTDPEGKELLDLGVDKDDFHVLKTYKVPLHKEVNNFYIQSRPRQVHQVTMKKSAFIASYRWNSFLNEEIICKGDTVSESEMVISVPDQFYLELNPVLSKDGKGQVITYTWQGQERVYSPENPIRVTEDTEVILGSRVAGKKKLSVKMDQEIPDFSLLYEEEEGSSAYKKISLDQNQKAEISEKVCVSLQFQIPRDVVYEVVISDASGKVYKKLFKALYSPNGNLWTEKIGSIQEDTQIRIKVHDAYVVEGAGQLAYLISGNEKKLTNEIYECIIPADMFEGKEIVADTDAVRVIVKKTDQENGDYQVKLIPIPGRKVPSIVTLSYGEKAYMKQEQAVFTEAEKEKLVQEVGTSYLLTNIENQVGSIPLPEGWIWESPEQKMTGSAKLQSSKAIYLAEGYEPLEADLPIQVSTLQGIIIQGPSLLLSKEQAEYSLDFDYGDTMDITEQVKNQISVSWDLSDAKSFLAEDLTKSTLQVTINDKADAYESLSVHVKVGESVLTDRIEVKVLGADADLKPILEKNKVTLHAKQTEPIEIPFVTRKGNGITEVTALEKGMISENFDGKVEGQTVFLSLKKDAPCQKNTQKKTYAVTLQVKTVLEEGNKDFPIQVTVDTAKITVTCKQTEKCNLFDLNTKASFSLAAGKTISAVLENTDSKYYKKNQGEGVAFSLAYENGKLAVSPKEMDATNYQKYANRKISLKIFFEGYQEDYYVTKDITVGTINTKPVLKAQNVVIFGGNQIFDARLWNKTAGSSYIPTENCRISVKSGNGISQIDPENRPLRLQYAKKGTCKYTLFIQEPEWTQAVSVAGTVKVVTKPQAVLAKKKLTINGEHLLQGSEFYVGMELKDSTEEVSEATILGKDKKTQALLDAKELAVEFQKEEQHMVVSVKEGAAIPKGTYTLQITPKTTGFDGSLAPVTLTLLVTTGKPTVKLKASGTLNLVDALSYVTYKPTMSNTDAGIEKVELKNQSYLVNKKEKEEVDAFEASVKNGAILIRAKEAAIIHVKYTYSLSLRIYLTDGTYADTTVSIKPVNQNPAVKTSSAKETLYRDYQKTADVIVSVSSKATQKVEIERVQVVEDTKKHTEQLFWLQFEPTTSKITISLSQEGEKAKPGTYLLNYRVYMKGADQEIKPVTCKLTIVIK